MAGKFKFFSKITGIKMIAIVYITVIYAVGGLFITIFSDKYLIKKFYDKTEGAEETISTNRHLIETVTILSILGVLTYIGRNILQMIPFPLDGVSGFKYMRVSEVFSGGILGWTIFVFSSALSNKIKVIHNRISLKELNV